MCKSLYVIEHEERPSMFLRNLGHYCGEESFSHAITAFGKDTALKRDTGLTKEVSPHDRCKDCGLYNPLNVIGEDKFFRLRLPRVHEGWRIFEVDFGFLCQVDA